MTDFISSLFGLSLLAACIWWLLARQRRPIWRRRLWLITGMLFLTGMGLAATDGSPVTAVIGLVVIGLVSAKWFKSPKLSSQVDRKLPVYGDYRNAPLDTPFQFSDDPSHIIRLRTPVPKGKVIYQSSVPVAGVTFDGRQETILRFIHGTEQRITVQHTPFKGHPNAITVNGSYQESGQSVYGELGYLPSEVSEQIAEDYPDRDIAATVSMMFLPDTDKAAGLRLVLWR